LRTVLRDAFEHSRTPAQALAYLVEKADFDRTEKAGFIQLCEEKKP
jgi:hypothetical protein